MSTVDPKTGQDVCFHCGGQVRLVAGPGRTFTNRGVQYATPTDLALLTCDDCGDELLTPDDTKALMQVVKAQQAATPTRAAG